MTILLEFALVVLLIPITFIQVALMFYHVFNITTNQDKILKMLIIVNLIQIMLVTMFVKSVKQDTTLNRIMRTTKFVYKTIISMYFLTMPTKLPKKFLMNIFLLITQSLFWLMLQFMTSKEKNRWFAMQDHTFIRVIVV